MRTPNFDEGTRRRLILGEFQYRRPVFESYKSLCWKIGKDTIPYQEFDFWFHRFAEGKMDLSYDRRYFYRELLRLKGVSWSAFAHLIDRALSLDPKAKELSDMPIEIVDNIVDHLGSVDRLTVRNVSQGLRALIDKRITAIKRISFNIYPDTCSVSIDDAETFYKESSRRKTSKSSSHKQHVTSIEGPKSIKKSLIHLAHYLKNPNLKLKSLSIEIRKAEEFNDDKLENLEFFFDKFPMFLQSIDHQIHTGGIWIRDVSEKLFLPILKSLKPGVLKDITLMNEETGLMNTEMMDEIIETDQWKEARELSSFGPMVIAVHGLAHFEEISFCLYGVTPSSSICLMEVLSASNSFRKAQLEFRFWATVDQFVESLGPRTSRDPKDENKWSYPIPDTNQFLLIDKFSENELCIRRPF